MVMALFAISSPRLLESIPSSGDLAREREGWRQGAQGLTAEAESIALVVTARRIDDFSNTNFGDSSAEASLQHRDAAYDHSETHVPSL